MNPTITTALIGAACAIVASLATFWIQSRRLPSEIRLTEAQIDKAQHESAALVISDLRSEIDRLKVKVGELEGRLEKAEERVTKAEARATGAESRLADAESRAQEFRRAVIAIGQRLDQERAKSRDMVGKLVGVIEHLLSCIEQPDSAKIDRAEITKLISDILKQYQPEGFVGV